MSDQTCSCRRLVKINETIEISKIFHENTFLNKINVFGNPYALKITQLTSPFIAAFLSALL